MMGLVLLVWTHTHTHTHSNWNRLLEGSWDSPWSTLRGLSLTGYTVCTLFSKNRHTHLALYSGDTAHVYIDSLQREPQQGQIHIRQLFLFLTFEVRLDICYQATPCYDAVGVFCNCNYPWCLIHLSWWFCPVSIYMSFYYAVFWSVLNYYCGLPSCYTNSLRTATQSYHTYNYDATVFSF